MELKEHSPEEKLLEIFRIRKSPHTSIAMINMYLAETHLRTGISRDDLITSILEVAKERNYVLVDPDAWSIESPNIPSEELMDLYISGCQWHSRLNDLIPSKAKGTLRVCSYNIHYFSWPDRNTNYSNIEGIMTVVDRIQPDIIGLQEALLPFLLGDEEHTDLSKGKHSGYQWHVQPNPSAKISDIPTTQRKIVSEDAWTIEDVFELFEERDYGYRSQCMGSSTHSKEQTYFGNILLSKPSLDIPEGLPLTSYVEGGLEYGRCATFAYLSDYDLVVCNLHLDVFDKTGKTRIREIDQIIRYLNQRYANTPTIVMGDLNALKRSDYTDLEVRWLAKNNQGFPLDFQTIDTLGSAGFTDVFNEGSFKYSVWSARRIDFIFVRNITIEKIISTGVMYTPVSDHLPIFVDIKFGKSG
jgi:endonuclease/exonuclease/phosphatase family metal-dependent hydrolase